MNDFPPPPGTQRPDTEWSELVVGCSTVSEASIKSIQRKFWGSIISLLDELRSVEIGRPEDEAWFHLRRTTRWNEDEWTARYSPARIEIMRLKTSAFDETAVERVRIWAEPLSGVVCAGWWPMCFHPYHDNAFLSFLQKLSLLRVVRGYSCSESLAQICDRYDICPYCRDAYSLMTDKAQPWHADISPWLDHMACTNMPAIRSHEYAHWFAHILSGGVGQ